MIEMLDGLLLGALRAGTPLLLIGLGVLISEKSGVLNLGQEGMVMVGAVTAFSLQVNYASAFLSIFMAMMGGAVMGLLFILIVQRFRANQVVSGLALTLLGTGVAAFVGAGYSGQSIEALSEISVPLLSELPVVGELLFAQDGLFFLSLLVLLLVWVFINRTNFGLVLTAVGQNPLAASQLGYNVNRVRLLATMLGGALAGLAGAYLALVYTPLWSETMSAGRGWIGLALVVLAGWRVLLVAICAYLFGLVTVVPLGLQAAGYNVPADLLAMLPYVGTLVALVVIAAVMKDGDRFGPPKALGINFE